MSKHNRVAIFLCCFLMAFLVFPTPSFAQTADEVSLTDFLDEESGTEAPPASAGEGAEPETGSPEEIQAAQALPEDGRPADSTAPDNPSGNENASGPTAVEESPLAGEGEPKTPVTTYMFMSKKLLLLPVGGNIKDAVIHNNIAVQYGRFSWQSGLDADWDFDSFNTSKPGRQTLFGAIILPEKFAYYSNGMETPLVAEQAVWVYAPGMSEMEEVSIDQYPKSTSVPTLTLPRGSSVDEVQALLDENCVQETVMLRTHDEYSFFLPCRWDAGLVDTAVPGAHYPYMIEDLPDGIVVSEQYLNDCSMAVVVVDPDRVDLSGTFQSIERPQQFQARWLYEAENPRLWLTQTSPLGEDAQPEWQAFGGDDDAQLFEEGGFAINATINCDSVVIDFSSIPDGNYWLQIRYDGGESNFLHVAVENGLPAGKPTIGDRIGDTDGNQNPPKDKEPEPPILKNPPIQLPMLENPAPQPPEPDTRFPAFEQTIYQLPGGGSLDQPEGIMETDKPGDSAPMPPATDLADEVQGGIPGTDYTAAEGSVQTEQVSAFVNPAALGGLSFTGAQLRALMAVKPEYVPFVQDDIDIRIPTSALKAFSFGDDDIFSVYTGYLPEQSLTVFMMLNGLQVTLAESFLVSIPWDGTKVDWRDAIGNPVSSEYDAEGSRLFLTFTSPGTVYCVSAGEENPSAKPVSPTDLQNTHTAPPVANSGHSNIIMIFVPGICCVAGILFLYFRKRRLHR